MDDPETTFLVAESDAGVVGFIRTQMSERSYGLVCEIETVVVAEGHRGEGVGAALVERAEEEASKKGAVGVRVNVLSANDRGRAFYEGHGYEIVAHRYGKELK